MQIKGTPQSERFIFHVALEEYLKFIYVHG